MFDWDCQNVKKKRKRKNIKNLQIALSGSFVVHLKSEKNPFRFVTHPLSLSLFFSFYLSAHFSFLLTLILFFYLSILLFSALSIFFILSIFLFLILVLSGFSISSLFKKMLKSVTDFRILPKSFLKNSY